MKITVTVTIEQIQCNCENFKVKGVVSCHRDVTVPSLTFLLLALITRNLIGWMDVVNTIKLANSAVLFYSQATVPWRAVHGGWNWNFLLAKHLYRYLIGWKDVVNSVPIWSSNLLEKPLPLSFWMIQLPCCIHSAYLRKPLLWSEKKVFPN